MADRIARLGDVDIEYRVAGEGPDLVWAHGLGGTVRSEAPMAEALATRYRVLWFSSRGHGGSSAPPGGAPGRFDYGAMAADLDRLLDHVGIERPVIAGGSHGANTALRHAVEHAGRARGVVLVAPGANLLRRPKRPQWWLVKAWTLAARRNGLAGLTKLLTGKSPDDPTLDRRLAESVASHDQRVIRDLLATLPDQAAVPHGVEGVRLPVAIAAWTGDGLIHPWSVAEEAARRIPRATLREIPRITQLDVDEQAAQGAALLGELVDQL